MIVEMKLEKNEWKRVYRYEAKNVDIAPIQHLYIRKFAFGKNPPKKIKVIVEGV